VNISSWIQVKVQTSFIGRFIRDMKAFKSFRQAPCSFSIPNEMVTPGEWYYFSATFKPAKDGEPYLIDSISLYRKGSNMDENKKIT